MLDQYQVSVSGTWKSYPEFTEQEKRMLDWSLGLAGECGEVTDIIKHVVLHREELNPMELAKEMGDVLWYLTSLAETVGIQMSDVMALNQAKLKHRHGNHYNMAGNLERHEREEAFKDTKECKEITARILKGVHFDGR